MDGRPHQAPDHDVPLRARRHDQRHAARVHVHAPTSRTSTFMCSLDGASRCRARRRSSTRACTPGEHRLEVTASSPPLLDRFGEPIEPDYDQIPAVYEWEIIDTIAPNASIDWGPRATTASLIAVFGLSSDDPTAMLECSLDGGGFNECEPVTEFTDLERGPHTLQVRARDLARQRRPDAGHARLDDHAARPAEHAGRHERDRHAADARRPRQRHRHLLRRQLRRHTTRRRAHGRPGAAGRLHAGRRALLRRRHDRRLRRAGDAVPRLRPGALPDERRAPAAGRRHDLDRRHDDEQPVHREDLRERGGGHRRAASAALFAIAAANTGIAPHVSILSGPPSCPTAARRRSSCSPTCPTRRSSARSTACRSSPAVRTVTYTHLEEGDHDFQVQAMSAFGLPPLVPTLYEWEVILPPDDDAARHDDHARPAGDHRELHQLARDHRPRRPDARARDGVRVPRRQRPVGVLRRRRRRSRS